MPESRSCHIENKEDKSRSVSPLSASRCREFMCDLSRRLGRRSHDGVMNSGEDDSGNSSESSSFQQFDKDEFKSNLELYSESSESSSSADDTEKTNLSSRRLYRRSLSIVRNALSDMSISPRSTSCDLAPEKTMNNKKTKKPPQKILRQPVRYTYLKGMSGLPTQRVPQSEVCCQYSCRRSFVT